jgi:RNA polymerase sigma factor (TIGR02999 family)
MNDVTEILLAIERGNVQAAEQLLPLIYGELHRLAAENLAHEAPGQTLQATALVHEAYMRLLGGAHEPAQTESPAATPQHWDSRRHFYAAAAEAMRRILLDRARAKRRLKRGGGWRRLQLDRIDLPIREPPDEILDLDEALEKLATEDPLCADLVKLRFFAGLTLEESARTLDIPRRSADRYWAFARSWLYDELRRGEET